MLSKLWNDEAGFLVSAELILVGTILVIGLITGLVAIRNAVTSELTEVAQAVAGISQAYSYTGLSNCASSTAGSAVSDATNSFTTGSVASTPYSINVLLCP